MYACVNKHNNNTHAMGKYTYYDRVSLLWRDNIISVYVQLKHNCEKNTRNKIDLTLKSYTLYNHIMVHISRKTRKNIRRYLLPK